ncbi:LOW QUALITY PROTEIN: hypothetical protein HID58_047391, partial [Brassica napus]
HGSHRECQPSRHTFLHLLKAGSLFTLSGFDVTRCNQNFGLTDTSLTIRFSDSTTFVELNEPVSPIPQERFRFRAHDSMYGLANINTHLPNILQGLTAVKSIVCDVPQGKERVMVMIKMDKLISLQMMPFIIFLIFQNYSSDYALIILLEGFQGDPRVVVTTIDPKIVGGTILTDVCFERYVCNTNFSIKRLMHEGFFSTKYLMVKLHNHVDWSLKNWEHSSTYIAQEIRQAVEHISELNEFIITTQPQIPQVYTPYVILIIMHRRKLNSSVLARYRVEMSIANDTDEGLFVGFDGEMTKLHNIAMSAIRFLWYPYIASHSIIRPTHRLDRELIQMRCSHRLLLQ